MSPEQRTSAQTEAPSLSPTNAPASPLSGPNLLRPEYPRPGDGKPSTLFMTENSRDGALTDVPLTPGPAPLRHRPIQTPTLPSCRECSTGLFSTATCSIIASAAIALSFVFWIVLLAGVSACQADIRMDGPGYLKENHFSFSWFLTCAQLIVLVGYVCVVATGHLQDAHQIVSMALAVLISWLGVECNTVTGYARIARETGVYENRIHAWAGGLVLVTMANIVLLIISSVKDFRPVVLWPQRSQASHVPELSSPSPPAQDDLPFASIAIANLTPNPAFETARTTKV